jgi:hypothetical protein
VENRREKSINAEGKYPVTTTKKFYNVNLLRKGENNRKEVN